MTSDTRQAGPLNEAQKLHLLSSCEYADKLLGEIEGILAAAASKSPFPKHRSDLSPAQVKVVQDSIARMRAQLLRMLDSQGIRPKEPQFGSIHSIRVTLAFADMAFDECRPKTMSGYGPLAENAAPELNGMVDEIQAMLSRLDAYLARGAAQDLGTRLEKLEQSGRDIGLLKTLERIISDHGLVEFRPALSTVLDRLENNRLEIALFGRVSSGKSSLLNCVLGTDILPVGVNPITSVPTRIIVGAEPRVTAWFAMVGKTEQFGLERLAELVTEAFNPGNAKHVTRVVVEIPSPRLAEGVVFVDTPGLGSLATAGASETLAYLPSCDLGVVLMDAGSTLTENDLGTLRALYDLGTPAHVLISKADLLSPEDRARVVEYVSAQIQDHLGFRLPVYAVSVKPECAGLVQDWIEREILPMYSRHAELSTQSLNRKIGALRESVSAALRSKVKGVNAFPEGERDGFRALESLLRRTMGSYAERRYETFRIVDEVRTASSASIRAAAESLISSWLSGPALPENPGEIVSSLITQVLAERVRPIPVALKQLAGESTAALIQTGSVLQLEIPSGDQELASVVKDLPRPDLGDLHVRVHRSGWLLRLNRTLATRRLEQQLWQQVGTEVSSALSTYGSVLEAWVRRMFKELQGRFDSYADRYRAHLDRLIGGGTPDHSDAEAIRRDVELLERETGHPAAQQASLLRQG